MRWLWWRNRLSEMFEQKRTIRFRNMSRISLQKYQLIVCSEVNNAFGIKKYTSLLFTFDMDVKALKALGDTFEHELWRFVFESYCKKYDAQIFRYHTDNLQADHTLSRTLTSCIDICPWSWWLFMSVCVSNIRSAFTKHFMSRKYLSSWHHFKK